MANLKVKKIESLELTLFKISQVKTLGWKRSHKDKARVNQKGAVHRIQNFQ